MTVTWKTLQTGTDNPDRQILKKQAVIVLPGHFSFVSKVIKIWTRWGNTKYPLSWSIIQEYNFTWPFLAFLDTSVPTPMLHQYTFHQNKHHKPEMKEVHWYNVIKI
jgi:hypothetical protein